MFIVCDADETVSSDAPCDVDVNGDCYRLHTSHKTWNDANDTCSSLGFHLAAVQVSNQQCTWWL